MATTSFTIRKTTVGAGSYLQKDDGTTKSQDIALRSDSFVETPSGTGGENTFSANVISIDQVILDWELSFSLSADTTTIKTLPVELKIVASSTGEPITIEDGEIVRTITSSFYTTSHTDIVRVPQGHWVYYSLFIKYRYTDTVWYERVATIYIQIPIIYNSVENLWSRIPEYYRKLDYDQETQPLYNFLELFGWEIDRTRTLIETIALSNDPDLAPTPAIRELAYQLGVEFDVDVLGTTKVRQLLQNIGTLRRSKGTLSSISDYLSAITGAQITYQYISSPETYKFKVHSQRINFVIDPIFKDSLATNQTGTTPFQARRMYSATYGIYAWSTGTSPASASTDGSSLTITTPSGSGTTQVFIYSRKSFPFYKNSDLYTSFETINGTTASFTKFHLANTGASVSPWESLTIGSSASGYTYDSSTLLQKQGNTTRVKLTPSTLTETTETVYPALQFTMPASSTLKITKWMIEPYSLGTYFDGSTTTGSLIPSLSGNGAGTSDYRWANGTAYTSFSYYMLDYKRVYETAQKIIRNYIAPVTIMDKVVVEFDYYFGKT